jgi:hypothetical protein
MVIAENLKNGHMLRHRILDVREDALRWEVREWERRADEQSQLLAELLQLIGMPEVRTLFFAHSFLYVVLNRIVLQI